MEQMQPDNQSEWVSVSDLARMLDIKRQSASEAIKRYESQGLLTTRQQGRRKFVRVDEFKSARGEAGDPSKARDLIEPKSEPEDPGYAKARGERERYQAENARLDLEERMGRLIQVRHVEEVAVEIGRMMQRASNALLAHSDELAAAAIESGAAGHRTVFKKVLAGHDRQVAELAAKLVGGGEDA